MDSSANEVNYNYAEANRFLNNYQTAERYYYKVWTRDSKNQFPQSQYWLGMMQKSNGNYRDAGKSFDRYHRRFARDSSNYFTLRAQIETESCTWALRELGLKLKTNIHHLDTNINTVHADFASTVFDSLMFFSSVRGDSFTTIYEREVHSKIYFSTGTDTTWTLSEQADSAFRFENYDAANPSFSKDGNRIYFTLKAKTNKAKLLPGIYVSKRKDDSFTKPERMSAPINLDGAISTQPFIYIDSLGKEILYFVSDRTGGFGKLDIWYSKLDSNGSAVYAVNAGRFINTVDNELSPFYHESSRRLYFSSSYPKGMGGFDIYYSSWSDSLLSFTDPENLGYPINSAANEYYYVSKQNDFSGYFSSNRKESYSVFGESCCNDIYYFQKLDTLPPVLRDTIIAMEPLPPILPPVIQEDIVEKIRLLVPLTLYFHNDQPDPKTTAITTKVAYDETFRAYVAMKDKYKSEYSKGLKGDVNEKAENEIDEFFRDQVAKGFDGLEKFAALMLENLEEGRLCTVTMQGFCSPLASTEYNMNLARRRIASLKNYFMQYGNGILLPYMSELPNAELKGKIVFVEENVGELPSLGSTSDNYKDQRNSVYSVQAGLERKIQIIAISAVGH